MNIATLQAVLTADAKAFDATVDKAETRLKNFGKAVPRPKIDVDTAGALQKIDALAAKIDALKNKTVSVTANTGSSRQSSADADAQKALRLERRVASLQESLYKLSLGRFVPKIDWSNIEQATGAVQRLIYEEQALQRANAQPLKVRGISREEFQVQKDWNSALAENERRAKAAAQAIDGIGSSARRSDSFLGRFSERVASLATSLIIYRGIQAAWHGLEGTFKTAIGYNSELQNNLIGTTNILKGNAVAAAGLQKELQQFAIVTPTRFKDLLPDVQQLLAAKQSVKDIIPELRAMGDAAFGLNRGQEGMNRLTLSFAQASATGKITGETLREMRHVGVPAIEYLAKAWHVTTVEMQDMISKGLIPAKEGLAAITAGMERQFHGQMDKMSHTAEGAFTNIQDAAEKILGSAFADTFGKISELANKASTIASNKDFQKWCQDVARWFQDGFGLAVESVQWLSSTTAKVAPLIIGALTAIGVRALFVGATQLPGASVAGIRALSALATQFMATGAASTLMAGIVGVALAALVTDFGGVRSKLIDGWKSLTTWIARQYDGLMKFLHIDEGGVSFEASVKATMPDVDKTFAHWKSSLASKMKGFSLGNLLPAAPDWNKWAQGMQSGAGKIPGVPDFEGKFLESGNAKKKAALKLEKDQLSDAAKSYDMLARAAEDSAKRQIAALTGVRDTLRELVGSMQDALLKEGVTSNPLAPLIASFEKKLNIEPRMKAIADATQRTTEYFGAKANAARSRLDLLSGGDGSNPGFGGITAQTSELGKRIGEASEHVRAISHGCQTMARMAYEEIIPEWRKFRRGTAKLAAQAFINAGLAQKYHGESVPIGTIGYNLAVGHGSGHAMTMTERGWHDQYGYKQRPTVPVQYVVLPPGSKAGNGQGVLPKLPSYIPKNNAATLREMYGANGGIAEQIDGTLSKIAAVPKAWGAAVRDTESSTNRFQVQTALANKEFQSFLRSILGARFDDFIGQLRGAANKADILLNRVRALHQSYKAIQEINKAEALRGQNNDPIAALRYDFAHERAATPDNQKQWEIFRTRGKLVRDMAYDTQQFIKAQQDQAGVLQAGAPFLKADALSLGLYARAIDLANTRLQLQNELRDRLNSTDAGVRAGAQSELENRFSAASQTYDAGKRRSAATGVLATVAAMKERASLLVMERGLIEKGVLSEQQIADRLEIEAERRETLNKLLIAGVPPLIALASANAMAAGSLGLKKYDAATAKLKEYSALVRETARTVALAGKEQAIYSDTPSYSPDLEKRLAMAREEARLRGDESKKYSDKEIQDRLGQFSKSFDAQSKTGALAEFNKLLGDAAQRMATAGDETGMAALKFRLFRGDLSDNLSPLQKLIALFAQTIARAKELREQSLASARATLSGAQESLESRRLEMSGKLSDLAKQELAWKYEDLQRAKDNNAATAEELGIREQIRDTIKETAQINYQATLQGLDDQLRALAVAPGAAREALQRRQELEKDANLSPDQRTAILAKENQISQAQKAEQVWKDSATKMQEMFRSSIDSGISTGLESGFSKGIKAGLAGFAKSIEEMFLDRAKDLLAAKLTDGLFGAGAGERPSAFHIGARSTAGFDPSSAVPLLASIALPSSVAGPPNLAQNAGNVGSVASTVAAALGIGDGGGANVQSVTINAQRATLNAPLTPGGALSNMGAPTQSQRTFGAAQAVMGVLSSSGVLP